MKSIIPLGDESCPECAGHGYDIFFTDDHEDRPDYQLEVNASCDCLRRRFPHGYDRFEFAVDAAAVAFLADLEAGDGYAWRCVEQLEENR